MSDDLIKRSDAIGACAYETIECYEARKAIRALPSADRPQDDEFKNFDRESLILLIEAQKERIGELLADRPQAEWIEVEEDWRHQIEFWKCSECDFAVSSRYNFCPNCGCRMKGAGDE